MNRTKKITSIILVVFLLGSILPVNFTATALELSTTEGRAQGELLGTLEGADLGQTDFRLGRVSNYLIHLPTHAEITKKYKINKDDVYYRNAFLSAFRSSFEIAYKAAYREANVKALTEPFAQAYDHGAELGLVEGQIAAMKDYYSGYSNDWERALRAFLRVGTLRNRYNLNEEPTGYQSRFENGFTDSFMSAYIESYQIANVETAIRNTNLILVDMYEKSIEFSDASISFSAGGLVPESSTPLTLSFPEATLYEPTYFSVYKVPNSFNMNNYKYVPVSSKFVISIDNTLRAATLNKPVELSFEYYGSERAGIYQWQNNQWTYLYTEVEEGKVSTIIPAGYYKGGEYAIFIDNNFNYISDIGFNWASKEIYTLMRREIVEDVLRFHPTRAITRAEVAEMFYKTLRRTHTSAGAGSFAYTDAETYGTSKDAIEYLVSNRYMMLDDSGAFNPTGTINYNEIETMMGMILSRTFDWNDIAIKMMYEKYARSQGAMDKTASITKAEVAYMIHEMFK